MYHVIYNVVTKQSPHLSEVKKLHRVNTRHSITQLDVSIITNKKLFVNIKNFLLLVVFFLLHVFFHEPNCLHNIIMSICQPILSKIIFTFKKFVLFCKINNFIQQLIYIFQLFYKISNFCFVTNNNYPLNFFNFSSKTSISFFCSKHSSSEKFSLS